MLTDKTVNKTDETGSAYEDCEWKRNSTRDVGLLLMSCTIFSPKYLQLSLLSYLAFPTTCCNVARNIKIPLMFG